MSNIAITAGRVNDIDLTQPLLGAQEPPRQPGNAVPNPIDARQQGGQIYPQGGLEALNGLEIQVIALPQAQIQVQPQVQPQAPQIQNLPPDITLIRGADLGAGSLMPLEGVNGATPQDKIQSVHHKVDQGRDTFRQILNGQNPPCTRESTAHLMWFLQALGSSKAALSSGAGDIPALYKAGALMLEDPQGRLEAWLNQDDSYSRSSSHLHGFQNAGRDFEPRGLDVRGVETPHDRRTILFQRLPTAADAPGGPNTGQRRMLFVKMEEHGCRGLSIKGGVGQGQGFFGSLRNFFCNIGDFFGHAFGFTQSFAQRHGLVAVVGQDNRDRIPSGIEEQYKALMRNQDFDTTALSTGNPLNDSIGIRQMKANLDRFLEGLGLRPETLQQMRTNQDTTGHVYNVPGFSLWYDLGRRDHLDLRVGNEVIFTTNELPQ